ncbi:MAG: Excinuclease ABC, subunit A [Parcubacteria group bacterium GW2011_GWA2_47_21]|nr:MAG: Excinuclease ABC, subunit A [Parcubacteria group bacterium GW2011_GWA2_47_21]
MSNPLETIIVKGARTHNLKNITVELPRNKLIVFTGLSGSGKSSLAFDTIFAEGQRRYVESLSAYARQFLRQMQKPDVDEIIGLSPAISIDQKSRSNNPRSTVATTTEIYDYLRVLFARVGAPHCLTCNRPIKKLSNEEITATILDSIRSSEDASGKKKVLGVAVDGGKIKIFAPVVVGRKGEYYQLLYDLLGKGYKEILLDGAAKQLRERIILDKNKKHSIDVLADEFFTTELSRRDKGVMERLTEAIERALHESGGLIKVVSPSGERLISAKFMCPYDGFAYPEVEPRLFSFNSPYGACSACNGLGTKHFFGDVPCSVCQGARLRPEALHVLIGGKNIVEVSAFSVEAAWNFFEGLELTAKEREIATVVLREIADRLRFMKDVGIEYLTLDRRAHTLSGGEAQRIRLASQLGSGLVGALYVLDEPTIGLHARDNARLVKTLTKLRDSGNTIIVVEHDEDTIFSSDFIVDIGPGAGIHGGRVVVAGDLEKLITAKKNESKSLTLEYLRGDKDIETPKKRRDTNKGALKIRGGNLFNIKNLNVDLPLGKLIAVTGVSGSGKSTFLYEIIHKNLAARFDRRYRSAEIFNCKSFAGSEYLGRSILIDQSPIGRTPRSNPATYTGAWTFIREMFATTEEARFKGFGPGRFSFNVSGGRCEACAGNGEIAVEMHFLPTVYVTCDICQGKRFMKETLEVRFKKKNVDEVLHMTVEEAVKFFEDIPAIYDRLKTLEEVGLGYLELGQSATTLSGGEAQRVKISSELYRAHLEKTIYLLDEPSIGLHYEDVKKLIEILQKLADRGNTVVVIEHNMDIIKSADYVIDFGPEGGDGGGQVVAKGTPEQIATAETHTGEYLKKTLKKTKN